MKKNINLFCIAVIVLISCSNSNAVKNEAADTIKNSVRATNVNEPPKKPQQTDGIVGDWRLALEAYDNNANKKLDDEERKKGFSNHYFYRFSADGNCIISPFATNQLRNGFKGHYVMSEVNGKKIITTIWDEAEQKGKQEAQYTIISVTKDELVLLETMGDHTFWIFTRV